MIRLEQSTVELAHDLQKVQAGIHSIEGYITKLSSRLYKAKGTPEYERLIQYKQKLSNKLQLLQGEQKKLKGRLKGSLVSKLTSPETITGAAEDLYHSISAHLGHAVGTESLISKSEIHSLLVFREYKNSNRKS